MSETKINTHTADDYQVIKREILYQGVFRMMRYHLRFKRFNGEWSTVFQREMMERSSATGILPYDPVLDQVILIEQFRPGALVGAAHPWLIEIIAGILETKETPADVALREAKEEAGCEILDLYPIADYFVSPGGSNEYLHLFCGRFDARQAGGIYGLEEENEDIRAFTLAADDAFLWVREGKIKTSPAIMALQWLQLNREWLKQLWLAK